MTTQQAMDLTCHLAANINHNPPGKKIFKVLTLYFVKSMSQFVTNPDSEIYLSFSGNKIVISLFSVKRSWIKVFKV